MGKFTLEVLKKAIGGLSVTSKMPGYSWSISAFRCPIGTKMRSVSGSICSKCYAHKGRYALKNVQDALERRYSIWLSDPFWTRNMGEIISRTRNHYFRWFDSGDLVNIQMMRDIADVARLSPEHAHWLPTRETGIYKAWLSEGNVVPGNLLVRISDTYINEGNRFKYPHTSGVKSKDHKPFWKSLVGMNDEKITHCPSSLQDDACGSCRACWEPHIERVLYLEH